MCSCSGNSTQRKSSVVGETARRSIYDLHWHATKCGAGRICGADLNGDNLQISRAYLRISDHCRVTVRVRVRVADCCIRTAGESDKFGSITRLKLTNAQQIRRAPHFVVSHLHSLSGLPATLWGQSMFWDDFVCMYVCMYVRTYVRTC